MNSRRVGYVSRVMRIAAIAAVVLLSSARPADACVQLSEANKLLGWSDDGKLALFARFDAKGKLEHAELHPTRYEGFKFVIAEESGGIVIKKISVDNCSVLHDADDHQRLAGKLTEASLMKLAIIKDLKLVTPPADDGAAKPIAKFTPNKRFADHKLQLREADKVIATLPVPVWCVGSCLRDEAFATWTAEVKLVAKAGDRTLYLVRMKNVCNAANDKDLWMDRVIAVPGKEAAPKKGRCRGSGQ